MLVLSRKPSEGILITDGTHEIRILVFDKRVKLGIDAPPAFDIIRIEYVREPKA